MSTEVTYLMKGHPMASLSKAARVAVDNLFTSKTLSYAHYDGITATAKFTRLNGQLVIRLEESI